MDIALSVIMEFEVFKNIRDLFCKVHEGVGEGKMMSSPAIHYRNKVFAFFSRNNKMVFKLGKAYPIDNLHIEIQEFNPFKNKGPLSGWYEAGYESHQNWEELTLKALEVITSNQKT